MSRVIFMCGPAGSGKSTLAKRLAATENLERLSFDVEAWARGHRTMPLDVDSAAQIEDFLRIRLIELIGDNRDVVLDFSFYSRQMREQWRRLLAPFGVAPETYYLKTDRATALARVRARAADSADDFCLPAELAAQYYDRFEEPTAEEGPLTVVDTSH
ncbi:AAA family ATPase [Psychromicrobium lacuslunae]|uniref:Aminoglycoside phosphotransferase n=1 Tax=Psychromicrobium lacuslunae TaxID=1618207 RepID=A0A0D4C1L6_9MICC|nr:ATP-binding protein [Psychromicrobium lacuslunae]AJT42552.1 aminoglycoside phosphotransferase [Psychromicrobium lacuslunae]